MSISEAKIWPWRNFCQFFPRQKLEVNKIGPSATRPLFFFKPILSVGKLIGDIIGDPLGKY